MNYRFKENQMDAELILTGAESNCLNTESNHKGMLNWIVCAGTVFGHQSICMLTVSHAMY